MLTSPSPSRTTSCDPRPPRRADATRRGNAVQRGHAVVAILVRPGGRTPPVIAAVVLIVKYWLRSSSAPEGGRHTDTDPYDPRTPDELRSSSAPEGGRHRTVWASPMPVERLRSSSAPEGGRHTPRPRRSAGEASSCDPRPPRRADATGKYPPGTAEQMRLRSSSAPEGGRHWTARRATCSRPRCCDPRPPRRADATVDLLGELAAQPVVAILVRPGGRTPPPVPNVTVLAVTRLRSSSAPEGGRHCTRRNLMPMVDYVAILVRPGGRTPPCAIWARVGGTDWLRSSSAPEGGRHAGQCTSPRRPACCDPRPPRRADATCARLLTSRRALRLRSSSAPEGGRHPGRSPPRSAPARTCGCCDPRPPRRADATSAASPWDRCH